MAEETNNEPIHQPPDPSPDLSPEEIPAVVTTLPISSQQAAENMEVHHHAHHPDTPHHKKNWKSYMWEFLMLFLAVFCGFLAEYQLEHTIEHQREKEYMRTMVEDLKSDTAHLTKLITSRQNRIIELDSLFDIIASDRYITEGRKVYLLYEFSYWDILRFLPSDRTMQQLKNSGNLRLIRKANVSDALISYDVWVRNRKEYEPLQVDLANQMNSLIESLVDPMVVHEAKQPIINRITASDSIITSLNYRINLPEKVSIPRMEEGRKKAILKYLNEVISLYSALREDNISEKKLALETLHLVVKEYGIE